MPIMKQFKIVTVWWRTQAGSKESEKDVPANSFLLVRIIHVGLKYSNVH